VVAQHPDLYGRRASQDLFRLAQRAKSDSMRGRCLADEYGRRLHHEKKILYAFFD